MSSEETYRIPELTDERPFRGMLSFQDNERDARLFEGRKLTIETLVESVRNNVLTVFYGFSGTGKTSLLNAGAIPLLRETGYIPIYIRLKFDKLNQKMDLVDQVKKAILENAEWNASYNLDFEQDDERVQLETLWEYFSKYSATNETIVPVLIFDQFEEIFTIGSQHDECLTELVDELHFLIENQFPNVSKTRLQKHPELFNPQKQKFRAIFSIREDYISKLNRLKNKIYSVDKAKVGLEDLSIASVQQIISKIQKEFYIDYFDSEAIGLLTAYLNSYKTKNIGKNSPISITLGLLCYQLNETRIKNKKRKIDNAWLKEKYLQKLMGEYYTAAVKDTKTRKIIEQELINNVGYRLSIPVDIIRKKGISEDRLRYLVEEKRILRYESRLGATDIEIVHDALALRILEIKRERRQLRIAAFTVLIFLAIILTGISVSVYLTTEATKIEDKADKKIAEAFSEKEEANRILQDSKKKTRVALRNANDSARNIIEKAEREIKEKNILLDLMTRKANQQTQRAVQAEALAKEKQYDAELLRNVAEAQKKRAELSNASYLRERASLLKLYANDFLHKEPKDIKRALLYALTAFKIDSSKDARDLILEASKQNHGFYAKMENSHPDSSTFVFENGKKLVVNKSTNLGFFNTFQNNEKYSFDISVKTTANQQNQKAQIWPVTKPYETDMYMYAQSTDDRFFYSYNLKNRSFKIWKNTQNGFLNIANEENATDPIFSKNNNYVAYYDSKSFTEKNAKFKIIPTDYSENKSIDELRKERNWRVSKIDLDLKDNPDHYAVLRTNQKSTSKKQVVLRTITGKNIITPIMPNQITGKLLGMDYLADSKRLFIYFENVIQNYTHQGKDSINITWDTAENVASLYIPQKNCIAIVKSGISPELNLISKEGLLIKTISINYNPVMPGILHSSKNLLLLLSNEESSSTLSLFNLDNLEIEPFIISIKDKITNTNFWLGKYIYFQTQSNVYIWHYQVGSDDLGDSLFDIESFYKNNSKLFSEFWELKDFDKKILSINEY